MQIDFHYYCIAVLAKYSGFSERDSLVIAYASQYVDDSTESEPIQVGDIRFDTVRTAHFGLSCFNWNVQKKIYIPFHFLPESPCQNTPQTFITKPDTQFVEELWKFAQKQADPDLKLCMLGIALHTIADTTAHQGFSGRYHAENEVRSIAILNKGKYVKSFWQNVIVRLFMPKIGHTEADTIPDRSNVQWNYVDSSEKLIQRNNSQNFLLAAEKIYDKLCAVVPNKNDAKKWDEIKDSIQNMLELEMSKEEKCADWEKKFGDIFLKNKLHYDKHDWRKDALLESNEIDAKKLAWDDKRPSYFASLKFNMKKTFFDSLWVKFHRAALRQRNFVLENIL